jgi:hypothetical protein
MDVSSPEFVAGRTVAVFALERFVRARTAFVVWSAAAITALLVLGAIASYGVGAFVVGVFAVIAAVITMTLFAIRAAVLRGLRVIGGGADYARLRPIVRKHLADVQTTRGTIPVDRLGLVRLAWMARRPEDLQQHVRHTVNTVSRAVPDVVSEVRTELARPA